jgi:hypothetical protein
MDGFNDAVVRHLCNFHVTELMVPTVELLRQKLEEDTDFQGTDTTSKKSRKNEIQVEEN